MRFLVTAGPTREFLDAVRFLSSPSSGRMGFACAVEAARRGHRVTLVTGPVELRNPAGVRTIRVTDAREMRSAVLRAFPRSDAVLMTAAVSDFRPEKRVRTKLKKNRAGLMLRLKRNPDILAELGRRKGGRILIGFALEVRDAEPNARSKLLLKNLDAIVLNSPRSFSSGRIDAVVIDRGGGSRRFRGAAKSALARFLVRAAEREFLREAGKRPAGCRATGPSGSAGTKSR